MGKKVFSNHIKMKLDIEIIILARTLFRLGSIFFN